MPISTFPIVSQWQLQVALATSSCPIGTKHIIIHSLGLYMLYVKFGKDRLHGFRGDVF